MALDECLLSAASMEPAFYLRVYSMASTFSIGRIQKYAALKPVFSEKPNYTIVRRPTGGGLVQHHEDLVVTIVVPATDRHYEWKVMDLYAFLHQLFSQVLASLAIETLINASSKNCKPELCFESPSQFDLMNAEGSRKIVGSAIKKSRAGILIQSSLNCGLKKHSFSKLLVQQFIQAFAIEESSPTAVHFDLKEEQWAPLVERHFSQAWKQKI